VAKMVSECCVQEIRVFESKIAADRNFGDALVYMISI